MNAETEKKMEKLHDKLIVTLDYSDGKGVATNIAGGLSQLGLVKAILSLEQVQRSLFETLKESVKADDKEYWEKFKEIPFEAFLKDAKARFAFKEIVRMSDHKTVARKKA